MQTEFYQRDETRNKEGGQFMFDFDGDEIFHVDLEKSETIWRLPIFTTFTSFEAQGALQNIAVDKQNMEIMMKRSNRSQGTIGNNPATARLLPAPNLWAAAGSAAPRLCPELCVGSPWVAPGHKGSSLWGQKLG